MVMHRYLTVNCPLYLAPTVFLHGSVVIVGVIASIGSPTAASLTTRQSIISVSILFPSFSPSSGYISILPISTTRWIWQSMLAGPSLVQVYDVTNLAR
jgi:hypothetical protein